MKKALAAALSASLTLSPTLSWADGPALRGSLSAPSQSPEIMNLGRLSFQIRPVLANAPALAAPSLKSALPVASPLPQVKVQGQPVKAIAVLGETAGRIAEGRQAPERILTETFDYFSLHGADMQAAPVPTLGLGAPLLPSGRKLAVTAAAMMAATPAAAADFHSGAPSYSGAAFLGILGGWLAGFKGTPRRDAAATNSLLSDAKLLRRRIEDSYPDLVPEAAGLALSIVTGDYAQARAHVDRILSSSADATTKDTAEIVRSGLPQRNFPGELELKKALHEVRSSLNLGPFELQERLTRLLDGILRSNTPHELKDIQIDVRQKASFLARERAKERRTPGPEIALQEFEDCWLHSLYHLPSPVLDPVRRRVSYEGFLAAAKSLFPQKDFREHGLTNEEFVRLLGALGLSLKSQEVTEEGLVRLLQTHGAVIGAVVWFSKDASKLSSFEALPFFRQHAVAITGVVETPEGRQFVVRDSLVPYLTRYTKSELDMLSLVALVIEPEGPGSVERMSAEFLANR